MLIRRKIKIRVHKTVFKPTLNKEETLIVAVDKTDSMEGRELVKAARLRWVRRVDRMGEDRAANRAYVITTERSLTGRVSLIPLERQYPERPEGARQP